MIGIGVFGWIAGALQLSIPSYSLRLIRRFGTERVGWFIVTVFSSLALLHWFVPSRLAGPAAGTIDMVLGAASALLLVGMGRMETWFTQREKVLRNRQPLHVEVETTTEGDESELSIENRQLRLNLALLEDKERSLKESEAQYRLLFMENPQAMWVVDPRTCRCLAVNNAALGLYGYSSSEFLTLDARDLFPEETVPSFLQDLTSAPSGVPSRGLWQHRLRDGSLMDTEVTVLGLPFGGVGARLILATDITARRQHEAEERRSYRQELIGQIGGGVAQHFSNVFSTIEGHAAGLSQGPMDAQSTEHLQHISTAAARGATLTRQLLAASGRQPVQAENLDVNSLMRNMGHVLRRLVNEQIVLETILGSYLPPAQADRRVVERIIINLVLNARDSMPGGGTITLSTAPAQLQDPQGGGAKDFVRVSVRDTGCGLTPEVQARLGEPFFTTGDGVGLGLAGIEGMLSQLGGRMEFSTEAGAGTEFRVFFPCAAASANANQTETGAVAPATRGTVLVVEPDDRVRALAHCTLNWSGYRVIEADSASTAMILWDSQAQKIDLLVTSFTLPDSLSGWDLTNQLRQRKPDLKVIYTCDSDAAAESQTPARLEGTRLVPKPYTPETLLKTVIEAFAEDF